MDWKQALEELDEIHEKVDDVYYGMKERYDEDEIPLILALHDSVHNIHEAIKKYVENKNMNKLEEVV